MTPRTADLNLEEKLTVGVLDEALARRSSIALTVVFWLYSLAVSLVRAYLDHPRLIGELFVMRLGIAAIGCFFCYLIALVLRWFGYRPFWQRALLVVLVIPFVADAFSWISFFAVRVVLPETPTAYSTSEIIYSVVNWVWYFTAWAALHMALRYSFEVKAQEERVRTVQALSHAAHLRGLRNQINPHFVFNSLNSISALILDSRNAAAEVMVTRLADFLRISLALDPLEDVRLVDELDLQRHYLGVEQARFPDLRVEVDVLPELLDALVPTLILQPLVENAVKYAIARSQAPATIRISATVHSERTLRLEVVDDGAGGVTICGAGIGLRNVRDRLYNRFGTDQSFAAGPRVPRGFAVTLEMPLRRV